VAHPARSRPRHGLKHRCLPCDRAWGKHHRWHPPPRFTGYVVAGATSTFGILTGDSEGQTADGGNTDRPCIAIREDRTLGRWFLVEVIVEEGGRRVVHRARLLHCDWGPGILSRTIDITGVGDLALGLSPTGYPTGAFGRARELR
jgi:hypothetical protein